MFSQSRVISGFGSRVRVLVLTLGLAVPAEAVAASPELEVSVPSTVKLALCLDTSGSMDGLIDSAKQKLWTIVNDLAIAKPTPRLEVALLTFGNDGHNPENGWVDVQTPFTDDLDLVSERLFALQTNGGTEYVGRVLHRASGLDWGDGAQAFRLAVVAGNEDADQDQEVRFRAVCLDLKSRGIVVNSVYCGSPDDGIAPGWREVALLAGGEFAAIDQNDGIVVIPTPYDDRLGELSEALNTTYVPFGDRGAAGAANQTAQDANAAGLSSSAKASRAATKASGLYSCSWDLIDACKAGRVKVADLSPEDLPEELQALTTSELAEHIEKLAAERATIQAEVQKLTLERDLFVLEEMKRRAIDESRAWDHAIRTAVRRQAEARGFRFPEGPAEEQPEDRAAEVELDEREVEAIRDLIDRAGVVGKGSESDLFRNASMMTIVPDLLVSFGNMRDWTALTRILYRGRPGVTELGSKRISVRLDGRLVFFDAGC